MNLQTQHIKKIMVANRGEIALRIFKTARKMGLKTVAIFVAEEINAPYVLAADEAYELKGETLADTFLNIPQIISCAQKAGAEAIHPGYGFLSEKTEFSAACKQAGLRFIGPSALAIQQMGDKVNARKLVQQWGIPVVPGFDGAIKNEQHLLEVAEKIGYPVLLKASQGGGGRGMRRVDAPADLWSNYELARSESLRAFKSDQVFIEKYIVQPRHVEVQVLCDEHNNHLHFYDRDCSVQRRHQKVIEEAPAFGLLPKTREHLHQLALTITRNMAYTNAGTLEFIMDSAQNVYFLEMNTRLQVEHCVSEMVTGVDLVALQIIVADGQKIPLTQSDIKLKGHAIEARLCAENPASGFLPTTGSLPYLELPPMPHVRHDYGIRAGQELSTQFDSMLGKTIAWAKDRSSAIRLLEKNINASVFAGLETNQAFLVALLNFPDFINEKVHTHLIAENETALGVGPAGSPSPTLNEQQLAFIKPYYTDFLIHQLSRPQAEAHNTLNFYRSLTHITSQIPLTQYNTPQGLLVFFYLKPDYNLVWKGQNYSIPHDFCNALSSAHLNHPHTLTSIVPEQHSSQQSPHALINTTASQSNASPASTQKTIVAHMPGKVWKILKNEGEAVIAGETILILEAMKMEHPIKSTCAGTITSLKVQAGQVIKAKQTLVQIS